MEMNPFGGPAQSTPEHQDGHGLMVKNIQNMLNLLADQVALQ